ncbi:MAG: imidazole glycerol phosphate synthase subunit HisH [Rhodocyclaceae bacterium]|jgi:glutamine amidotransferase|nr:imidazole glycerol phosphate synthase subunit HisH [Rhodocyclaceae bacterium]
MKIGIIDYGMGNTGSVCAALTRLGAAAVLSSASDDLDACAGLILPGVGAFRPAMERLAAQGLDKAIHRWVDRDRKPLLGICLGMQLLAKDSTEGGLYRGLSLVEGHVVQLEPKGDLRVPHVGWNEVHADPENVLFHDIAPGSHFFFDHSYHLTLSSLDISCAIFDYGGKGLAAFQRGHLFGVQFHPEKSQYAGAALLKNFLAFVAGNTPVHHGDGHA